jgi:hypothetical protein
MIFRRCRGDELEMEFQCPERRYSVGPLNNAHRGRAQQSTNGKRIFVDRPGDTAWHRRFKDVFAQIISDLGGWDYLSEGQKQLARRATTLSIKCEQMEGRWAAGEEANDELYGVFVDRLGRTFDRLGLQRKARDVTPTLTEYLRKSHSVEVADG